jgi:hypothetical protein
MMHALKCACGLGVEGGHRIANWLLEEAVRTPANYELRPFSVRASAKKGAQWCLENQGRPKHKANPLLRPEARGKDLARCACDSSY